MPQEITLREFLPEDLKKIEDIALDVAERGIIYGDNLFCWQPYFLDETVLPPKMVTFTEEDLKLKRLENIIRFLSEQPEPNGNIYYTIRHGQDIIGFAVFWNGWIPFSEDGSPMIELAFMHPDFKRKDYVLSIIKTYFEKYSLHCKGC